MQLFLPALAALAAASTAQSARVVTAGAEGLSSSQSTCNASSFRRFQDTDLNGGDLPNQPASKSLSSADECAALCCAADGCAGYSLNAGSPETRWCYLKAGGWSRGPSPGVESGLLGPPPSANFPWFNRSLSVDERISALLAALTLAEQISLLDNSAPAIPRLSLPSYDWEGEASHGVAWAGVATAFPSPMSWGASFDVPLVAAIADVIALEARAKFADGMGADGGSSEFFGLSFMVPNTNLVVDSRWGRSQETTGEVSPRILRVGGFRRAVFSSPPDTGLFHFALSSPSRGHFCPPPPPRTRRSPLP